jgi:hypothetical protein
LSTRHQSQKKNQKNQKERDDVWVWRMRRSKRSGREKNNNKEGEMNIEKWFF